MIFKLISSCFFVYFLLYGKWNLAQSNDPTHAISAVTHSDISLQDPDYSSGAHTYSAPTFTSGPNGGLISPHTASPVFTSSVPIGGAQVASPVTSGSHIVATPITPGAQAMGASMTFAAPVTHGAQVATHVAPGAQAMPTPMMPASHVTTPATPGAPIAGAPLAMAAPVTFGTQVGAPIAGAPLAMATPMTFAAPVTNGAQAGIPVTPASHIVATPVTHGSQAVASPIAGSPVTHSVAVPTVPDANASMASSTLVDPNGQAMGSPIAGAPLAMGTPVTPGTQPVAAPMTSGSHIVTTPATPGAPSVTISLDSGETSKTETKPLEKIQIDIKDKRDTPQVKYRRNDAEGMDIFYAKDGYIINEIYMNGNKRWPQDNEVKECKKVLFIIDPEDGKKTLKVIYDDEPEAYDPDNPPKTSTNPTQAIPALTQEADSLTHTSGSPSSPGIIPQSQITLLPAQVTTQQTHTPTPLSNDFSHTIGDSNQLNYQKAEITPVQSAQATPDTHVEHEPSLSTESFDPTGWTVPLEPDKRVHEACEDQTSMGNEDTSLLFAAAEIDHTSQHISSPQLIKTSPYGERYVDIKMDSDEQDDDQPHHGFHVEEVRGYDPDDDDGYERVPLTQYVTDLGYRVGDLENRMDSAEDTIKLLVRTLDYQHEILEFRRRFGAKTAPFGADLGRQAYFDVDAFKPATSQVSKVLDATEHPSDIKLFVLKASDSTDLLELGTDKFKVKQEGDEIHYLFETGVECKLVTFKDRTVWNHRGTDPHPLGVVFHPDDDKVVVDFDDAIVMYVKKGDLAGSSAINIDSTEEVDSGITELDSTTIATENNDTVSIETQSSQ